MSFIRATKHQKQEEERSPYTRRRQRQRNQVQQEEEGDYEYYLDDDDINDRNYFNPMDLVSRSSDIPWTSFVGEADRSLRLGIQYEKSGQYRQSFTAFHEAATLYQCYLESARATTATTATTATAITNTETSSSWKISSQSRPLSAYKEDNEFAHVTQLHELESCDDDDNDNGGDDVDGSEIEMWCRSILAYACIRMGFLNYDALGDPMAAARLYEEATNIDIHPSAVAYHGMGNCIEAAAASSSWLRLAIDAYQKGQKIQPIDRRMLFHLAVALERLNDENAATATATSTAEKAEEIFDILRDDNDPSIRCLIDSWGYVRWHTRKVLPNTRLNLYRGTRCMIELAIRSAVLSSSSSSSSSCGLICEFGVGNGRSIRMIQEILASITSSTSSPSSSGGHSYGDGDGDGGVVIPIHGFDTFTGLPEAWGDEPAGSYSTGGIIPTIDDQNNNNQQHPVYFHKGLFTHTIKPFLRQQQQKQQTNNNNELPLYISFMNIDCDLYSSTIDIFTSLHGYIVPGTIIIFDEYICHPTWRYDEFRAFKESCKRFGYKYEYLAFSLSTKQAIVRIIDA